MPPAAPESISSRRSLGVSRSSRARHEPNPAPICAIGPSCPAEPPVPIVITEATALISGTRVRICPAPRWKARIRASVPCPSASGASEKTSSPETRPADAPGRAGPATTATGT